MTVIADILLIAGAIGAGFYCYILARRLTRFTDLEKGVGGAVAVLSSQVDELSKSLDAARMTASHSTDSLEGLTQRAETVAKRLELLVASMHDLPETAQNEPDAPSRTVESVAPAEPAIPMFRRKTAETSEVG